MRLLLDHGLKLAQKLQVGQVFRHGPSSYLYLLVALNISVYPGDIQVAPPVCRKGTAQRVRWRYYPGRQCDYARIPHRRHPRLGGRAHVKKLIVLGAAQRRCRGGSAALFGAGVAAAAPDVAGQTYADAVSAIEDEGSTAVVASRVGGKLEQDECIVTRAWTAPFGRSIDGEFGLAGRTRSCVALNCNAGYATATNPGASLASPGGREAKAAADEAAAAEEAELAEASHARASRRSVARHPAEQHVDAVVDELLAGRGQAAVQVGGEQRRQRADQAGRRPWPAPPDR